MLVIGNGVSRKGLPLDKVYQEKVGCNAIFRDHYVQHLVCCDKRMVKQALPHHDTIYTRQRWNEELGVLALPDLVEKGTERMDDPFLSVNEPNTKELSVYPNPATDQLNIEIEGEFEYQVFDLNGKLVLNGRNDNSIDVSSISNGQYLLKAKTKNEVFKSTFIKE